MTRRQHARELLSIRPETIGRTRKEGETLRLDVASTDAEQLDRLMDVVERHLVAFGDELAITWH
jgi:hypothetical protein